MKTLSLQRAFEPWLLTVTAHAALVDAIASLAPKNYMENGDDDCAPAPDYTLRGDGVAVLPINGVTCLRPSNLEKNYFGMTCLDEIGSAMDRAMKDPMVSALVLQFNSPGGTANGSPEFADKVRAFADKKPVVAFTDSMMASAAYQAGSQANVIIATRSAAVGSIGSVISYLDVSKAYENMGMERKVISNDGAIYKGMGAVGAKLTPEQEAQLQRVVNTHGEMFKRMVTERRPRVQEDAMRGQTLVGNDALSAGLIDQVGGLDLAIKTASGMRGMRR